VTRAEFRIESTLPGGDGLGGLFAASIESLPSGPTIRYQFAATSAVLDGDRRSVLSALRRLERAVCATCVEEYLITIRIDEDREF
jgi:uncharacterized protein YqgV (UPF0045/DUF77 family)